MLRIIAMLGAAGAFAGGCVVNETDGSDSSLTVTNESDFQIQELYITRSHVASWGPNLLGSQPLLPGQVIVLAAISCDTYDVLLVDETSAQCEVDAISLCFDDADWVIQNNTCDVFTVAATSPGSSTRPDGVERK